MFSKTIASNYTELSKLFYPNRNPKCLLFRDKSYFRNIYNQIWNTYHSTARAKDFIEHLKPIDELCRTYQEWDESRDIRETWGIPIPKKRYRAAKSSKKSSTTRVNVRVR